MRKIYLSLIPIAVISIISLYDALGPRNDAVLIRTPWKYYQLILNRGEFALRVYDHQSTRIEAAILPQEKGKGYLSALTFRNFFGSVNGIQKYPRNDRYPLIAEYRISLWVFFVAGLVPILFVVAITRSGRREGVPPIEVGAHPDREED